MSDPREDDCMVSMHIVGASYDFDGGLLATVHLYWKEERSKGIIKIPVTDPLFFRLEKLMRLCDQNPGLSIDLWGKYDHSTNMLCVDNDEPKAGSDNDATK